MIFRSRFYPFNKNDSKFKHIALIGIGCNVGNCIRRFKKLFLFFQSHPKIDIISTSYLYKNPPFGYLEQEDFINSVIVISTSFSPIELLNFLLYTEKKFNRVRTFKNAPRTLDLDIIMYDNIKLNKKRLILPHPYFKKRDSVLLPLYLLRK
ncbi:MAG: 2-amino-4-hydroxy-6-hydroxymethyldihydropteridine diphosphokinase [Nautilia sp.]|nr:MAG: 2-amino-4-hydroxy-6-hydroxymethyldihydropteridine diphosphokinase [Nautilia sp.]